MFKYLLKFIKFAGKQRKHMIIALVFGLLQSIFTAFSLLATAYALQNMIEGTATMSTVWSAFGIVGGGVLLAAVCNYFSTQFLTYAGYTIAANARIRIADKLKYAPMGYFNEHNLGQIANTATNTAESLQDTLTRCLLLTTKGLFMALVITISLLVFDWRIGLVAAAGFVLFLVVNHFLHKAGEKNSDRKTVSGDKAVEAVLEYVQGIAVIKSYNLTGKANKKGNIRHQRGQGRQLRARKELYPVYGTAGCCRQTCGRGDNRGIGLAVCAAFHAAVYGARRLHRLLYGVQRPRFGRQYVRAVAYGGKQHRQDRGGN